MAAQYPLLIDQGSTFRRDFVYKDSLGDPIDLTGYTARMMIRRTAASDAVVLDTDDHAESLEVTGAEGRTTLLLTDEVTAALPAPFEGRYDIELESGSGEVLRLVQGPVRIDPNVTR